MTRAPFFRASVGVVVARDDGRVLALERSDVPGAWQLPQGGLDAGETPLDAALRELAEETGLPAAAVRLEAEHPDWLAYELPPERRRKRTGLGQVQKWFLFRFAGDEAAIRPADVEHPEFSTWRWMPLARLAEETVAFRRPVYRRLVEAFGPRLADPRTGD